MEQEIKLTEEELKSKKELLRKIDGGQVGALSKQIKQKENELDKKLQRYNEALAFNKQLRTQINNLRKERTLYDNIYNQLEVDILNKKNELLNLIEASEKAEKTKEEYINKLQIIKQQAEKEQEDFQKGYENVLKNIRSDSKSKWEEQSRISTEHDQLLKGANSDGQSKVTRKKVDGSNKNEINNNGTRRSIDKLPEQGRKSPIDSPTLKKKTLKAEGVDEAARKVEEYKEMFNRLMMETQQNDIELILKYFNESEDANQKLFTEVNQLNDEVMPQIAL